MASDTLRLGLIGAGRIGSLHAEHVTHRIREAEIVAVADVKEAVARQCAERNSIADVHTDYRPILDRADVDAVLICSATDTHAQAIQDVAAAGKHIFVEKPIALDLGDIDRSLAAVESAGVKLQVGFHRRFDASYRRVHDAIRHGDIGAPHLFHIVSRDPHPPHEEYLQASGGLFLDMTIHDFDMARYLIGGDVEEVYAVGGVQIDPRHGHGGDVDTALTTLKFSSGVFGSIDNSRQAVYGYDQRVEVFGSRGSIETANHFPNAATISTAESIRRDLPYNFFMDRYTDAYTTEIGAFVTAVTDDQPTLVTGEDGRLAVVMGLAARLSLAEQRPVSIDEVGAA